jgi:hypothetical protein
LEALNLPTKRPFKKRHLNEQEKQIHSMVSRLAFLESENQKLKTEKNIKMIARARKRDQKI